MLRIFTQLKTFLLLFLLVTFHFSFATSYVSTGTGSGDFNDPLSWNPNGVPSKSDDILVQSSHAINLNVSFWGGGAVQGNWIIQSGASLTSTTESLDFNSGSNLTVYGTLQCLDMEFSNGCVILIESTANIGVLGDLTNNNNSNNVTVNSSNFNVSGTLDNGNGSVIGGTGAIAAGTISNHSGGSLFGCVGSGCDCAAPTICVVTSSALPIELITFEVVVNESEVNIKWATSSEINNEYFTVERSIDGKHWRSIVTASGAGNSNQTIEYFEVDYDPVDGVSYYRLKQTDFDGNFTYSGVVTSKFSNDNMAGGQFFIYPNPVNICSTVNIEFTDRKNQEVLVVLQDIAGREYFSKMLITNNDGRIIGLPLEGVIPAGIYLVTAASDDQIYSQKLVIK